MGGLGGKQAHPLQWVGSGVSPIYGVVTTGNLWCFLELEGTTARVDKVEYPIHWSRKIFGLLTMITLGEAAPASVVEKK